MKKWENCTPEEKAAKYDKVLKEIDRKHAVELNKKLGAWDKIITELKKGA